MRYTIFYDDSEFLKNKTKFDARTVEQTLPSGSVIVGTIADNGTTDLFNVPTVSQEQQKQLEQVIKDVRAEQREFFA